MSVALRPLIEPSRLALITALSIWNFVRPVRSVPELGRVMGAIRYATGSISRGGLLGGRR